MIVKRLHTNSKIFFPDPYMVRVEFADTGMDDANLQYRKITRSAYKLLKGTWGYSNLEMEVWQIDSQDQSDISLTALAHNQTQLTASLFTANYISVLRAYVCFAEEADALQFRLSISAKSRHVKMWPKKEFTIHEVVEVDES